MKNFTLEEFRNLKSEMETKYNEVIENFWSIDEIIEADNGEF